MMTNSNWETNESGFNLLLLLGLNGKRTNDWENAVNECLTDTMTDGYNKFKQIIIRIQELETKGNEKNLEEEVLFRRLKVENEDIIALHMGRNAAAEQGEEEDPAGDVDVEDDTSEGYKDEEDAE
jgi:hypothetical protein